MSQTLRKHHVGDLGMLYLATEPSLFYKIVGERLIGIRGVYVESTL